MRVDGTSLVQSRDRPRQTFLRTGGMAAQAQGSAYIEAGDTKVIVSVYGPRDLSTARRHGRSTAFASVGGVGGGSDAASAGGAGENNSTAILTPYSSSYADMQLACIQSYVQFGPLATSGRIINASPSAMSVNSAESADALALTLNHAANATICRHVYPKSTIDITFYVVENHGSLLAAALTAAGLALADAGIEVYDTLIGLTMLRYGPDVVIFDPSSDELATARLQSSVDVGAEDSCYASNCALTLGLLPSLGHMAVVAQDASSAGSSVGVAQFADDVRLMMDVGRKFLLPLVRRTLMQSVAVDENGKPDK